MKQKLNLTINENVIKETKKYARKHGLSVSKLIENLLANAINQKEASFAQKWKGKLNLAEKDEPRYQKLTQKYL